MPNFKRIGGGEWKPSVDLTWNDPFVLKGNRNTVLTKRVQPLYILIRDDRTYCFNGNCFLVAPPSEQRYYMPIQ